MDLTVRQEVGVGALVLTGVALFVALLFWLTDRDVTGRGVPVEVVFTNASGIKPGDAVHVSGVRKGRVSGVRLEAVGRVRISMSVEPDVSPKLDAAATVVAIDFLGNKVIEYSPGAREEPLPADAVIVGTEQRELADMASGLATRADELLGSAQALVSQQLGTDIHNTLVATQRALEVLTRTGSGPLVAQTTATLAATERTMARLDTILGAAGAARVDTLTANLARLSTNLSTATASLDTLLGRMSRGEGSLGKLATDSLLYRNLNETLTALTSLLNDLRERPGRYLTVKVF